MNSSTPRIAILATHIARKIAAGEVIERPASALRELIDNSVDAGAREISIEIERGGIEHIRIVDNGRGMDADDLALSIQSHATSKIRTLEDLDHASTLGFRGEALASIAAVSRLVITSGTDADQSGNTLSIDASGEKQLEGAQALRGSIISIRDIFYALPARKRSLRSAASESGACKTVVIEKALAFWNIAFRFAASHHRVLSLPAVETPERRIADIYPGLAREASLTRLTATGRNFSLAIATSAPSYRANNRRHIYIFVNNRRIREFSLSQAIEYAYSPYLPGGSFPAAFVFISVDPEQVDFNIHPAKREALIRNKDDIRQRIIETLNTFLETFTRKVTVASPKDSSFGPSLSFNDAMENTPEYIGKTLGLTSLPTSLPQFESDAENRSPLRRSPAALNIPDVPPAFDASPKQGMQSHRSETERPRYLGQIFNLFLLVEIGDRLLIIDQHAAHERALYERYRAEGRSQRLLTPIRIETSAEQDRLVTEYLPEFTRQGIAIEQGAPGLWHINALPAAIADNGAIVEQAMGNILRARESIDTALVEFYATMACRAAVKEGDHIPDADAKSLIDQLFSLPDGRCPHGRPIWFELTHAELLRFVGRR